MIPSFSAAVLGIPRIDKTVIPSATGGMLYEIAGSFQQDSGSPHYWAPPSYSQLKLVQLSGPELKGHFRTWAYQQSKDNVVAYVDWVVSTIPESIIYLTMPDAGIMPDGDQKSKPND